ncbi:MAG: hypothetical protein DRI56_02010, partial [Chloroflexota bacterium]
NAKGRNLGGSRSPPLNSTVFCRIWGRQGGGRTFQQPLSAPGYFFVWGIKARPQCWHFAQLWSHPEPGSSP